jgi:molybdopterin synthase sulfur carrier subunit
MNILFFASLREQVNTDQEQWHSLEQIATVDDLRRQLQSRGEPWKSALDNPKLIVSVNQEVVSSDHPLTLNDEVAFFPPVTGG